MKTSKDIRIGGGAAWWGDRIDPARSLAESGALDYLCFETMAEMTVSSAQIRKRRDPDFPGYEPNLDARIEACLPGCIASGTKLISNQGWINPDAAADRIAWWLGRHGVRGAKVAAVNGSLITERIEDLASTLTDDGRPVASLRNTLISAEAYLGAEPIVEALRNGAQYVVTGRVADPSLFLAPMMHEFGWCADDWPLLAAGSAVGHLLECGAQVTGGYFPDPGFKDVPRPWDIGFPIAEVNAKGEAVITKLAGTGGAVNLMTVKEQMLYEVHDPSSYITPDVVVDFTTAQLRALTPDRVAITSVGGRPRTPTLKASIACAEGFICDDMFFYSGPGALRRAELARDILLERFRIVGLKADEVRIDFLGHDAIFGPQADMPLGEPNELAVRVAARCATHAEALKVARECDGMAVFGVSATGKRFPFPHDRTREVVGVWSALVPRAAIVPSISYFES